MRQVFGSTSIRGTVAGVPDYVNNFISNGCGAISTAMFIAYYDNELLNALSRINTFGDFPLEYSNTSNNNLYEGQYVIDLAWEMAIEIGTCDDINEGCTGTNIPFLSYGIANYFDTNIASQDYDFYVAPINDVTIYNSGLTDFSVTNNEFENYVELIETGNPAIIMIGEGE